MRKRLIRAVVFAVVAISAAIGVGSAAGAIDFGGASQGAFLDGSSWS